MADTKLSIICDYCEMEYSLKYDKADSARKPEFCSFCGELYEDSQLDEDDDDEEDLDEDYEEDEDN